MAYPNLYFEIYANERFCTYIYLIILHFDCKVQNHYTCAKGDGAIWNNYYLNASFELIRLFTWMRKWTVKLRRMYFTFNQKWRMRYNAIWMSIRNMASIIRSIPFSIYWLQLNTNVELSISYFEMFATFPLLNEDQFLYKNSKKQPSWKMYIGRVDCSREFSITEEYRYEKLKSVHKLICKCCVAVARLRILYRVGNWRSKNNGTNSG